MKNTAALGYFLILSLLLPIAVAAQDGDSEVICPAVICCNEECLSGVPEESPCREIYSNSCEAPEPTPLPTECEERLSKLWLQIDETLQDPVCAGSSSPGWGGDDSENKDLLGLPDRGATAEKSKSRNKKLKQQCRALRKKNKK